MTQMALLGLFILAALAILFAAVFVIGDQQLLFTATDHLRTGFSTVSGLLNGAEVRIEGVRNGTVDEIRLPSRPGERVVVSMSLDNSTLNPVKKDSIAAIETEGLLGNKFIAISFGSKEVYFPRSGPVRQSRRPKLKDKKRLNEVGAYLEKNPFGLVIVQAFSGRLGDREDNLVLTQAQAMVVRDYLADKFDLDETKLRTQGMGEVAPKEKDRDHWVEISVYAPEA